MTLSKKTLKHTVTCEKKKRTGKQAFLLQFPLIVCMYVHLKFYVKKKKIHILYRLTYVYAVKTVAEPPFTPNGFSSFVSL